MYGGFMEHCCNEYLINNSFSASIIIKCEGHFKVQHSYFRLKMPRRCCIPGCKSNYDSTLKNGGKAVSTFSFPRDEDRRRTWIRAIPRSDWTPSSGAFVCSEHFDASEVIRTETVNHRNGTSEVIPLRNPKLVISAVPHIFANLPGHLSKSSVTQRMDPSLRRETGKKHQEQLCEDIKKEDLITGFVNRGDPVGEEESFQHADILCNNCQNVIVGFRYKCITCEDYDLCQKCEMMEIHSEHYVLRIPKPLKYKEAAEIAQKLKQIFKPKVDIIVIKEEDPIGDSVSEFRDDESIQDDNVEGDIHFSEQFKNIIHSEVNRVIDECKDIGKPPRTVCRKKKRIAEREMAGDGKRVCDAAAKVNAAPEIAFADANSDLDNQDFSIELKQEICEESGVTSRLDVGETVNPYMTENLLRNILECSYQKREHSPP